MSEIKKISGKHSLHYLDMANRTDRIGRIKDPDGRGRREGVCGDRVEVFIRVQEETIQFVSFVIDGCRDTNACANAVSCLTEGRHIDKAWAISPEDVIDYLETLQPEKKHCAELTVGAFYLALANYRERERASWKKLYG